MKQRCFLLSPCFRNTESASPPSVIRTGGSHFTGLPGIAMFNGSEEESTVSNHFISTMYNIAHVRPVTGTHTGTSTDENGSPVWATTQVLIAVIVGLLVLVLIIVLIARRLRDLRNRRSTVLPPNINMKHARSDSFRSDKVFGAREFHCDDENQQIRAISVRRSNPAYSNEQLEAAANLNDVI